MQKTSQYTFLYSGFHVLLRSSNGSFRFYKSKVSDCSRELPEGSIFNSYIHQSVCEDSTLPLIVPLYP